MYDGYIVYGTKSLYDGYIALNSNTLLPFVKSIVESIASLHSQKSLHRLGLSGTCNTGCRYDHFGRYESNTILQAKRMAGMIVYPHILAAGMRVGRCENDLYGN